MQPEIIAYSLTRAVMTMGISPRDFNNWTLVDHHWPIDKEKTSSMIYTLKELVYGYRIQPEKNLGGHGGFNFAIQRLIEQHNLSDTDLVLGYDPDSNPITKDWLKAMIQVMTEDTTFDYISLMHSAVVGNRNWTIESVAGHRVARDTAPEMFNVTLWRGRCIKQKLTAYSTFYGHVESSMWGRGFKNGYMIDFLEDRCPIQHPDIYTAWKVQHAMNAYRGNFDEYIGVQNGKS